MVNNLQLNNSHAATFFQPKRTVLHTYPIEIPQPKIRSFSRKDAFGCSYPIEIPQHKIRILSAFTLPREPVL